MLYHIQLFCCLFLNIIPMLSNSICSNIQLRPQIEYDRIMSLAVTEIK